MGVVEWNQQDIASGFYRFYICAARAKFAEWQRAIIIPGPVPETLSLVTSDRFAFAHIDMNCALPEVAAIEFLCDKLVPRAILLFDDYAYLGYHSQNRAVDRFAQSKTSQSCHCRLVRA